MLPAFAVQAALTLHARAWAHQAHVALEHIPELRQFVQAQLADEYADRRNARILLQLLEGVPFGARHVVAAQELVQHMLGVVDHRAEFVEAKALSAGPEAVLPEVHGAPHADADT